MTREERIQNIHAVNEQMNYRLYLNNKYHGEYRYIEAALAIADDYCDSYTAAYGAINRYEIRRSDMACATWTSEEGLIYSEEYKAWYADQQASYQKVAG